MSGGGETSVFLSAGSTKYFHKQPLVWHPVLSCSNSYKAEYLPFVEIKTNSYGKAANEGFLE